MKKWRVWVYESRRKYIDVEAPTEDEAWEKANETDEDDFIIDHDYDQWEIERPYRIYEDNKVFSVGDRVKIAPDRDIKKELWNATGTVSLVNMDDTCTIDFDKEKLKIYQYSPISNHFIVSEDAE